MKSRANHAVDWIEEHGGSIADAARQFDITNQAVSAEWKRRNKSPRHGRTGRPPGSVGTCAFCGAKGHGATGGTCSKAATATDLVRSGMSAREAARLVGCSYQNVYASLARSR